MFESQDAITKMFLGNNLQTLKMREGETLSNIFNLFDPYYNNCQLLVL
jgi:hypothetical protein